MRWDDAAAEADVSVIEACPLTWCHRTLWFPELNGVAGIIAIKMAQLVNMILAIAFAEALGIYALIVAVILLFVV